MTTISTEIPDTIFLHAKTIADREEMTLDQFVALALASQISSWEVGQSFAERAKKGDWEKARKILAMGSDLEPEPEDRL
jgi:hypothetical protein